MHLDLTIDKVANTTTSLSNFTITADNANGTYRWLDCDDNYALIPNATSQSYTATANGNYAVEITENGCSDTSSCVNITGIGVGLNQAFSTANIQLYPNPSSGNYNVNLDRTYASIQLVVIDLQGRQLLSKTYSHQQILAFQLNAAQGMYWLILETENGRQVISMEREH